MPSRTLLRTDDAAGLGRDGSRQSATPANTVATINAAVSGKAQGDPVADDADDDGEEGERAEDERKGDVARAVRLQARGRGRGAPPTYLWFSALGSRVRAAVDVLELVAPLAPIA